MRRQVAMWLAGCLVFAATAQPTADKVINAPSGLSFIDLDRAEGLAAGHPNELWRVRALRALKLGQVTRAVDDFRKAARYGDKFSQHALSLLHWHGAGVARDRALAYAWSDLAAERGYPDLLRVREKMWSELAPDERERVADVGADLYATYGDAVARPRLHWEMRKAQAMATGSRLGFEKDRIQFTQSRGDVAPRDFHARERWVPREYWRAEDRTWSGRVIVLPAEKVDAPADPGTAPESD